MLKRLFSIITISLIIAGSFFNAYSSVNYVYADDNTDAWTQVTTNQQLVEAFKYYCKSRDLTIEGSVADAVTSFTTQTFNGICNTLGIDVSALQAQIKYQTDGNLGNRFLFTALGIDAYNRIFAQFLQDNDLAVGDSVDNEIVDSGIYYTGYDNFTSKLYVFDTEYFGGTETNHTITKGTPYKYDYSYLYNSSNGGSIQPSQNNTLTFSTSINNWSVGGLYGTYGDIYFYLNGSYKTKCNYPCGGNVQASIILYKTNSDPQNRIRVGYYIMSYNNNNAMRNRLDDLFYFTLGENLTPTNIYITTNNTVINNNNYEGDTIINNNGDTNYPDNPDNPDIPDPNPGPTPDPPTIPDSGGWQDFSLPDMPNDWLIYGMEKKFPFDIPFNILFALSLLNHEPEIPKFEGDIDLQVCTWHYDIDLTPFDDIATILRKFEVLGFIIGLAILTKNLINWG